MCKTISILLTFWLVSTNGQAQDLAYIDWTPGLFDKQELKDSFYNSVIVYKYTGNCVKLKSDTVYAAAFNRNQMIIFERQKGRGFISTKRFDYNEQGELTKLNKDFLYNSTTGGQAEIFYKYDDGKIVQEDQHDNYSSTIASTFYYYNAKKQIQQEIGKSGHKVSYSNNYYYNERDSLTRISSIHFSGNKIDSIIQTFAYDSRGRRIEETYDMSPTYEKTFPMLCPEGHDYRRYEYDDTGRKIYETTYRSKKLKPISTDGIPYIKYEYLNNIVVKNSYNSDNSFSGSDVYSRIEKQRFDNGQLLETCNTDTRLTTFLSQFSKLPKTILYPGKTGEESVTYIFEYKCVGAIASEL